MTNNYTPLRPAVWLIALILFATGCAHTIQYPLTEQDRWQGPKIDHTLRVSTFADEAPCYTNAVIKLPRRTGTDEDEWRTNYRDMYKGDEIAKGTSIMIAHHMDHSGLFQKVVSGPESQADWELSGAITEYSSIARVNQGAEIGQAVAGGFGLVGALIGSAATSQEMTEIRAGVDLQKLQLKNLATGQILWEGSVNARTNCEAHFANANAGVVPHHADRCLKRAIAELIERLGHSSLTNAVVATPAP